MPQLTAPNVLAAARESLSRRLSFNDFLTRLTPKDRQNAEKRVTALEAEPNPDSVRLWQRLACTMMSLAPHSTKFVGKQTVQFYVADGKYRMQVFALEDVQDGNITVFCPDVLDEAVAAGVLARTSKGEEHSYTTKSTKEPLNIEALNGRSLNPAAHFKDLLGWNRKAIRIVLPASPSAAQVEATELLCAMAAQHFAPPAAATAAAKASS